MSQDLEQKIESLAQTDSLKDGALVLGSSGTPDALASVLSAIDNTMLPRVLVFTVGETHIEVLAGGRRLRALSAASDDISQPGQAFGTALSRDDTDQIGQAGELFAALTAKPGTLTLQRRMNNQDSGHTEGGIDIRTLAQIWQVDLGAQPMGPVAALLYSLGDAVLAHVEFEAETTVTQSGDSALCDAISTESLQQDVAEIFHAITVGRPQTDAPDILVLEGKLPGDAVLCIFQTDASVSYVATRKDATPHIASAWNQITS